MRGEDLFKQRGSCSRQADDEDRLVTRASDPASCGKEFRGADGLLKVRVALDVLGPVAALGLLQRIAALVVFEGLLVRATVLQRLSERKTQVITIGERCAFGEFL